MGYCADYVAAYVELIYLHTRIYVYEIILLQIIRGTGPPAMGGFLYSIISRLNINGDRICNTYEHIDHDAGPEIFNTINVSILFISRDAARSAICITLQFDFSGKSVFQKG